MNDLTYLINPSERAILNDAGDRLPLGLLYMAKELEKHNHPVKIFDLNHDLEGKLLTDICKENPTMIGVSCLTSPLVNEVDQLGQMIKSYSKARLVVGGYHPSVCPEDFKVFDNVVIGEGEYALECLVSNINGRIFKGRNVSLIDLGKPSRDLVDSSRYNMQMDGMRTSTMITSRGCPNSCVFCGNLNKKVRYSMLEDVREELIDIKASGYDAVYFLDDVFTIDKERASLIGQACKNIGLKYRATTRANYTDNRLVRQLAETGCVMLSLGVESGNSEVLKAVGKGQTKDQIRDCVKLCGEHGIKTKGFFIIGLPGETEETAKQTIEFGKELRNYGMLSQDYYPMIPFPGTVIWKEPEKYGLKITDRNYSDYLVASRNELKVVCETKDLKADRIKQLLIEAKNG